MRILITDSGVGGLSVCAYAERLFRSRRLDEPVRLTFVNAAPENDFGYNSMATKREKLETFDRFLHIMTERFAPDMIVIACNTLSVLLEQTPYFGNAAIPVHGIVETGVGHLIRDLGRSPDRVAMIFGTVTTIEAQTYPDTLQRRGIPGTRIISQACPGLADTISEDRQGSKAAAEIMRWVREAVQKLEGSAPPCLCYLACTHYGYRRDLFSAAFEEAGIDAEILNPNAFLVDDLFGSTGEHLRDGEEPRRAGVEVISRYRIPETALETLTYFLAQISPETVDALRRFTHLPELF